MKQRQNLQTLSSQKKSAQNGIDATATKSQTQKNHQTRAVSIYIIILCIIGFTSPFLHVVLDVKGLEGYLGYKYMSSFLFAAGNRLSLICIGLLFLFASKQVFNEYKTTIKFIAYSTLFVGTFFGIQILIPKETLLKWSGHKDLPKQFYYIAMVIGGVLSVIILKYFQNALLLSEQKLRKIIAVLMDSLYKDLEEKNLINPWMKKEFKKHRIDVTNKVVDYEQGKL